jgi:hypothetical protein
MKPPRKLRSAEGMRHASAVQAFSTTSVSVRGSEHSHRDGYFGGGSRLRVLAQSMPVPVTIPHPQNE